MHIQDVAFSRTQNLERRENPFRTRDPATPAEKSRLSSTHLAPSSSGLPANGGVDALEVLMKLHDLMDETTRHAVLMYFVSTPLSAFVLDQLICLVMRIKV
jgi:hypothetical protein